MKLYISADMEGTSGICHWDETEKGLQDYTYFAEQMTKEVNAVCKGALESGKITDILVKDAHDSGRNLIPSLLPKTVRILRDWEGAPGGMMAGVGKGFDAVAFTGYHSAAYTTGNPLAHTSNRQNQYIRINGRIASEMLVNTYTAAYYQVPVIFLSGDKALCEAAKELIPNMETVAVSESLGGASVSLHPDRALELLQEGMGRAVKKDIDACQIKLPEEFHVEIEFKEYRKAYTGSFYPGVKKVGAKGVEFYTRDYYEVLRMLFFVL